MDVMDQYNALQIEIERLLENGKTANMLNADDLEKLADLNQQQLNLFRMIVDKNP